MSPPREWLRSLSVRFWLVTTTKVGILVLLMGWTAHRFHQASEALDATLVDIEREMSRVDVLEASLEQEDDAVIRAISYDATLGQRDLAHARARFDKTMAELVPLFDQPSERSDADELKRYVRTYREASDRLLARAAELDARARYQQEAIPSLREALATCSRIRRDQLQHMRTTAARVRDESDRSLVLLALGASASLLASVLAAIWLARRVVRPVRLVTAGVRAAGLEEFDQHIPWSRRDEVGALVAGFNRMTETLGRLRKARIDEIVAANETLQATLGALPDAVFVADAGGIVIAVNRAAAELIEPDGTGRPLGELHLRGPSQKALSDLVARALADKPPELASSEIVRTATGERRMLPRAIRTRGGRLIIVLYDVTELARLDEMRSELVAIASHELRTPLTTLQMTLPMLREGSDNLTPRQREMLTTATLGCTQLASTVDEFLDLARIEAGQLRLACSPVDVDGLVREVVDTHAPRFQEAGVTLQARFEGHPGGCWADRERLRAVVTNLLSNAVAYTPRGGTVRVDVEKHGGRLRLAVTDSGSGVPEALRERVFEKYFRVDPTHPNRRGSGIGLYVSRQIVEAHGGSIRCEAGPEGKGARLVLEMPARAAAADGRGAAREVLPHAVV
jgi:NtrC-family two-component system sensor histidine kinase KinB